MEVDLKSLRPLENRRRREAVLDAVLRLKSDDEVMTQASEKLGALSSRTHVDAVDASPDGIFVVGGNESNFEAVATVYVELKYGSQRDSTSMSDSYPALVRGHFEEARAVVDGVEVDTSSFYS